MKRIILILIGLLVVLQGYTQTTTDNDLSADPSVSGNLPADKKEKIEAAVTMADAVQKAGAYVKSLSDLFTDGNVPLPVGIKKGDYSLIIQKISRDGKKRKPVIHASCAFRFKDTGQIVAFEGEAVLEGKKGLNTSGKLKLIAPVKRNIGKESVLIIHEGSAVNFGCEGVESFDVRMSWVVTSQTIIPVDANGAPANTPLSATFETRFHNFDDYLISLNIDKSFCIKGLNDVIFTLKGATLDQSDIETSAITRFPDNYLSPSGAEAVRLWKGVSVTEASIGLPQVFNGRSDSDSGRITVALQQVLFDENGFTGNAVLKDIIKSESLNPGSWAISLNDFSLSVLKNRITAFGFGGDINIPPFGKNSLLPYFASINPATGEYEFKVNLAKQYDFPVLRSTLTLNELSTIDILFKGKDVYPVIRASGKLSVNAPLGEDSAKVFSISDIVFENMVIQRESPYLQIGAVNPVGDMKSPKIAGFELSLNNIRTFESGLSFEGGIDLNDIFSGVTGVKLYGDYEKWKFGKLEVERVKVDYQSSAFSLSGGVWFKNGDAVYGDGFRGDIRLSLLDKFSFDAVGVFGKKEDYKYFLTDVFFETSPASGIPIPPILSFYGFGGGLYKRMQQEGKSQSGAGSGSEFGQALSGIRYVPDKQVGLGVMANALFATTPSSNTFNAKVGFEMQFNASGGLNFAQLRGSASFIDMADKLGNLSDNISGRMKQLEASNAKQPEKALKINLDKIPETKNSGFLTASLNIEYDLIHKTFSADLYAFLNAGLIKGVGPNDRLGWASAYFSPDTWHMYLGTPDERLGVKVLNLAELSGYFMLGDGIPALPLPPDNVMRLLSPEKQAKLKRSNSNSLASGKGLAFGAKLGINFDARLTPFYAHLAVGLGGEFTLVNMNGVLCEGYNGTPGINGWYSDAQAWAFVEAGIGIQAKVFAKTRKFSILDLSAGVLLQGAGPNPLYFAGAVGGQYRILGGLIKGNCTFDFEMGEKCIIERGSPFGEDVIAQLTPGENDKDVNVFSSPQAIFNIPVGQEMTIEEDNIKGTYMAVLEEFNVKYKDNGQTMAGRTKYSDDGTVYMLMPDEPFESQKDTEVYAKVSFKKKINNNWVYVNGDDGKPVYEIKTAVFRTGDRPEEILPEHVKYSYPINRQYNYYTDEYKQGYIQLTQNYSYLFSSEKPEGFDQKIRFGDGRGTVSEIPFTYTTDSHGNDIRMEINFPMDQIPFVADKIYKLSIVNIPLQTEASIKSNITSEATTHSEGVEITRQRATETLKQLSEKEIYALSFRTSGYKTFSQKIKAFDKKSEGWRDYVEPYIHYVKTNLKEPELFDAYEIQGVGSEHRLIRFTAPVDQTEWYNRSFYPEMYQTQTYVTPPVQKVEILTGLPGKVLTDDEISIDTGFGFNTQGIFRYALPYWCARDFFAAKDDIARRAVFGQVTQQETGLLNTDYPPVVLKGDYPVNVSYVLPGKETITSTVSMVMYNPVEP
jgi:hypothetical protein